MISSVTDSSFDADVVKAPGPVLVKFEAPWCGPCKAMKPMLDEVAQEFRDKVRIVTVDIDQNGQTPSKYRVRGVPTVMLFDKGTVVTQKTGLARKAELVSLLRDHLG